MVIEKPTDTQHFEKQESTPTAHPTFESSRQDSTASPTIMQNHPRQQAEDRAKSQVGNIKTKEEEIEYSTFSKKKLVHALAQIAKDDEGFKKTRTIQRIRAAYDIIFNQEKQTAFEKYMTDEGAEAHHFQYRLDEQSVNFEDHFKQLKNKQHEYAKQQDAKKERNLALKRALLEKLREFVDADENTEKIQQMKKMQQAWSAIGRVPPQHNKALSANYHALLNRYYDHRDIYFELKDLDRQKNLAIKQALCKKAEALEDMDSLDDAVKKLDTLHEEYKQAGPLPKSHQKETWQRFKSASDKIYDKLYVKKRALQADLKESYEANHAAKQGILEKITAFTSFSSSSAKEWGHQTQEILALKKQWENVGEVSKEQAQVINQKFWKNFKIFFHHKKDFFAALDKQRKVNLQQKKAILKKATQLLEKHPEEDKQSTAEAYKSLQKQWKNTGLTYPKAENQLHEEFTTICNEFFQGKREHTALAKQEACEENLTKKEATCESLEKLIGIEGLRPKQVYELQHAFGAIGAVPKEASASIQSKYEYALDRIVDQAKGYSEDQRTALQLAIKLNNIKAEPNGTQKLSKKEYALRRKVQTLENEIVTWRNNMSFFDKSKNASDIIKDFELKIQKAEKDLSELKKELTQVQRALSASY